jgi:two-component system cell cycle sensor histidine kinase/response regulator CckA
VLTILLVEDDDRIRAAFTSLLQMKGFEVLGASDGVEALAVSRSHTGAIDLLISDCVMANMSGPELGRTLRVERPQIKIIHMSGYTDDTVPPNMTMDPEAVFLGKPVTLAVLMKTIEELCGGEKD